MTIPTAREAQEQARATAVEKQEQLCELSRALAVLASASVECFPLKFHSVYNLFNSLISFFLN